MSAKESELNSLDEQMTAAINQKEWDRVEELNSEKENVQAIVDDLKKKDEEANLYDLGLLANIEPPQIDILSDATNELILQISFKSGSKLFYTREGKKAEYDLGENGIKYAFRVAIGKVKITSDQKIVEISEDGKETEKTLRDKGINDSDFTIESLFLDFENANIASYDSERSVLPKEAENNALLQSAMVNYFKNLADSDNPYVLGYGIQKNEVKEEEEGLFYPTGVAYSTSYSSVERASTFNFLMLLDNHAFPSGNDSGVLPTSMMEYAQDKTSTINGVFGLSVSEFEDVYISSLSEALSKQMYANSTDKTKFDSINFYNSGRDFGLHFKGDDVSGTVDVKYQGLKGNNSENGVDIVYEITSKAKAHQELDGPGIGPVHIGTVGVDWSLSTSGQETPDDMEDVPKGKVGSLTIGIKAGATGKLELINSCSEMVLGFDDKEPEYRKESDAKLMKAFEIAKLFIPIVAIIDLATDFLTSAINPMDGDLKDFVDLLNIQKLGELENKIIMPISSVYAYKNVRLFGNDSSTDELLLFDTSYAPVAQ